MVELLIWFSIIQNDNPHVKINKNWKKFWGCILQLVAQNYYKYAYVNTIYPQQWRNNGQFSLSHQLKMTDS